jgi:magnesium transporter
MEATEIPREPTAAEDLREAWLLLDAAERAEEFARLPRADADDFFLELSSRDQWDLLGSMPVAERRSWMRLLPPDDAADAVQAAPEEDRAGLLALLDDRTRSEVTALLAYAEDDAGGLMSPRFARVRPDMTVDEAIAYLRRQTRDAAETIYAVYVLDPEQRLLGVISFRELFEAAGNPRVGDLMEREVVTATEDMDQEQLAQLFRESDLLAIPVVDPDRRVKGIVTVDDIVDVVTEADTEDMQKMGGSESLGAPYGEIGFGSMFRKRGGWLAALFLGEMLTATAMAAYEEQIAHAVVLALFIPLIISSGGNSGSQATTIIIRAISLGEVRLRDMGRVMAREAATGLALGLLLGAIGSIRIATWQVAFGSYGEHFRLVILAVGLSLVGVVLFGTLVGATLPFLLRRAGFDPASASAPLVATVVDVAGLVIYFSVAGLVGI